MQIRNAIPWIRWGPINVQNISAWDLYVNYQGDPLNVIRCSTKKWYEVRGRKTDSHFKIHYKLYGMGFFWTLGKPRVSFFSLKSDIE